MKTVAHAAGGTLALLTVAVFVTSTLVAELFLDHEEIAAVKRSIAYAIPLLVLFMAMTGGSGFALAKNRSGAIVKRKTNRMKFIAANGILVLAPAAVFLHLKASGEAFDSTFYTVQAIEICAGLLQLSLLGLNFRDGLALSGKLRKPKVTKPASH